MESGRCVLGAGCLALSPKERRDAEEHIAPSLAAELLCFLLPPSPSLLETVNSKWSRRGPFTVSIYTFFLSTSSVYSPCLCKEEEMQRFRFCFEGEWRGGSICSLGGKALSGTLHAHGGGLGAEGCKGCVCVDSTLLLPCLKQYETFEC